MQRNEAKYNSQLGQKEGSSQNLILHRAMQPISDKSIKAYLKIKELETSNPSYHDELIADYWKRHPIIDNSVFGFDESKASITDFYAILTDENKFLSRDLITLEEFKAHHIPSELPLPPKNMKWRGQINILPFLYLKLSAKDIITNKANLHKQVSNHYLNPSGGYIEPQNLSQALVNGISDKTYTEVERIVKYISKTSR
ncbi:MAG TPA: hypothetical protein VK809_03005 [Bacteroidia bacterium]|jgi:hypothetical protein|nr:hypothetical protein [Bacteroidia bacterium]